MWFKLPGVTNQFDQLFKLIDVYIVIESHWVRDWINKNTRKTHNGQGGSVINIISWFFYVLAILNFIE